MSIGEFFLIAERNFFLAEEQAHGQVKKVQIKPSFIAKLLTCVSGHSLFFIKCGFNRIKSMLMAFQNEKGKWALKNLENFAYKLILIFDRTNYFWNQKKPLEGKILNCSGKFMQK